MKLDHAEVTSSAPHWGGEVVLRVLRRLEETAQFAALRDEALASFEVSGDARLLPLIALALARLGEPDSASEFYVRAEAVMDCLDQDALVDLASVDTVLGRVSQSQDLLAGVLKDQPRHALAWARLAECLAQKGSFEDALQAYRSATELNPRRVDVYLAQVGVLLQLGDYAGAQLALDGALQVFAQVRGDYAESVDQEFTAQLRASQLSIWVRSHALAQAEYWLGRRRDDLAEADWVALLLVYVDELQSAGFKTLASESMHQGLKTYPDNRLLLDRAAQLAQKQGDFAQAIALIERGLYFEKNNPELHCRLACIYLQIGDAERARVSVDKALDLGRVSDSAQVLVQVTLARVHAAQGQMQTAEQILQQALEKTPQHPQALSALISLYKGQGKIAQALDCYAQLKPIDATPASRALMTPLRGPAEMSVIDAMSKVAAEASFDSAVRSHWLFELSGLWDKKSQHHKAFECVHQANQLARELGPQSSHNHRDFCARIRLVFGQAFFQKRRAVGVDSTLPVFLVSLPRSGASVVEQILARHSQIAAAGALGIMPRCIAGLERWERHTGSGRGYPDCVDDMTPEVTAKLAQGVLSELKALGRLGRSVDQSGATHVLDSLPGNAENIGLIKLLFARAKIISVIRDPHDVGVSNYFAAHGLDQPERAFSGDLAAIGEHILDYYALMQHWMRLFPDDIIEIQYEQLVANPEEVTRSLLAHLELPWEPQLLPFSQDKGHERALGVSSNVQAIDSHAVNRWQPYLRYMGELVRAANTPLKSQVPHDLVRLPEPGYLQRALEHRQKGEWLEAERVLKTLLHFLPEHGAANYLLGLVFCDAGYRNEGMAYLEKALAVCPWRQDWRLELQRLLGMD